MSRIFLSHSSQNNGEAQALFEWLEREGWNDEIFLDISAERGIAAGELWERKLNESANRCEAVLFLVSKPWIESVWCRRELNLAHRLNKRLFGVLIEDIPTRDLPTDLTNDWQMVNLASGRDHIPLTATLPITHDRVYVTFSTEGLQRLKAGLSLAGLAPRYFPWPPAKDPERAPYRGLRPLEAEDAGIFFGRDGQIIEALDRLRGVREAAPPRLLVVLGSSGSGKSSFLRAGLLPRMGRDDRTFRPLPVIRPHDAVITGDAGLMMSLEGACRALSVSKRREDLRDAINGGAETLQALCQELIDRATPAATAPRQEGEREAKPPTLVLAIDQGEELFRAAGQDEARQFLTLLRGMTSTDSPAVIVVFTIRSDMYERLQLAKEIESLRQETLSLPPMPKGSYAEVIKGPPLRLKGTKRSVEVEEGLVNALLVDIDEAGGKDALPLLAFTLERLYAELGSGNSLKLEDYEKLGRIKGSIEAAVEGAFKRADKMAGIPHERAERLALLRRGLIPSLATIDPESGEPLRRVARRSEIPAQALALIDLFVDERLLATDMGADAGEPTIEPAHEALLRQWSLLRGWLAEDTGQLRVLQAVKRAAQEWTNNGEAKGWLTHTGERLDSAEKLFERPDLAANLAETDRDYLAACRKADATAKNRKRAVQIIIYTLLIGVICGLVGWINQRAIVKTYTWYAVARPYMNTNFRPHVLTVEQERALKPGDKFTECGESCPTMIVVPAGEYMMGSPAGETGRADTEGPRHPVTIAKPFAVSIYELRFGDWDACVKVGGCVPISPGNWPGGNQPVINVSWIEAQQFVAWLSLMTGKTYRLLSEAEWEYAARATTSLSARSSVYYWGDDLGRNNANCPGCRSKWDGKQPAPVGSFAANAFGLYDMLGNVWEWVEDCYFPSYAPDAPADATPRRGGECATHVVRGGSWVGVAGPSSLPRSAIRDWRPADGRTYGLGVRIARTLDQ